LIVKPGTVAYWRDLFPGENKFVFLLGTFADESGCERVAYFTISSQTKWAALPKTRREMVDIPRGTLECLTSLSFIQCWWAVRTITKQRFIELERTGDIMYRGELPQFVDRVRWVVKNSDVLSDEDIDIALAALR